MNTETITKRGIESALYVCPAPVAASRVVRERVGTDAVTPFQGTGLPFAGNARLVMADVAAVPGVGPAKLDKYGEQVLALLVDA